MKVYLNDSESAYTTEVTEGELAVLISAYRRGVSHSQIIVSRDGRSQRIDVRHVCTDRTLSDTFFERTVVQSTQAA